MIALTLPISITVSSRQTKTRWLRMNLPKSTLLGEGFDLFCAFFLVSFGLTLNQGLLAVCHLLGYGCHNSKKHHHTSLEPKWQGDLPKCGIVKKVGRLRRISIDWVASGKLVIVCKPKVHESKYLARPKQHSDECKHKGRRERKDSW